ncbi:MAG: glycosyltransferase [Clostridia bacterium]|nr:glycosyltransferase [Clostridia bacterium]
MIITIVCDVLGEENNGTTIAAMNLIRALKEREHEVRVVCADQYRQGQEGFYVVPNLNLGKALNNYVKKAGVTLAKVDKKIIESAIVGSDVVHLLIPFPLSWAALKIAKKHNIPTTAGFHMMAEIFTAYIKMNKCVPLNMFIYKFIDRRIYKHVDAVHYPSQFIQDRFEKIVKHKTNGYVISNGVNDNFIHKPTEKPEELKDKFIITMTGRYAKEKTQDTLLKAMKYSKHANDIQLILAGQGVKEKYYKKLAKDLPVYPIFKLFDRQGVCDLLNYTDLYVHAGQVEIEGIAFLEALACGNMVLASDSKLSATKSFVKDEKCIFKWHKPKDLARVIDYWFEHQDEMKEYKQRNLEYMKGFDQKTCMDKMEQMFVEVIKKANEK